MDVKKILIACCISGLISSSCFAADFGDVDSNYWSYKSINELSKSGILTGYQDNTFRPDDPVTRAEFATMIIKVLGKESVSASNTVSFSDVKSGFWAANNINKAYKLGLVNGFPDGKFYPYNNVTRIQVMAVLSNALEKNPIGQSYAARVISKYNDSSSVPGWAVSSVANLAENKILVNYPDPNLIKPNASATRAEVASMLYNLREVLKLNTTASNNTNTNTNTDNTNQNTNNNQSQAAPSYDEIDISSQNGLFSEIYISGTEAAILSDSQIPAIVKNTINTGTAKYGDKVYLRIADNINTKSGQALILRGSQIIGQIESVSSSKNSNGAEISIKFNTLVTPQGQSFTINAVSNVRASDVYSQSIQTIGQKASLSSVSDIAAGAIIGSIFGKTSGTGAKKGAIEGATSSLGLNRLGTVLSSGEIQINQNDAIIIKFTSPIVIDTKTYKVIYK